MMTGDDYRESLRDGRSVYLDGRRVDDVTTDAVFSQTVDRVADTYDRYYRQDAGASHPMYDAPSTVEGLRQRIEVLLDCDMTASLSAVVLALVTSSEALRDTGKAYPARIEAFAEHCRANDLRVAEAITDAKGDRMLAPSAQQDRDMYVRVVDRVAGGLVVRGCKMHITGAAIVHELVVLPTKQMKPGEEDYAIAFAIPVDTPGVHVLNSAYGPRAGDRRDYPISSHEHMPDGFVVFDDVFVPEDRVFLDGEVEHSARLAHALGLWERSASIAKSAKDADLLVGLAELIAEANGTHRVPHIRDKIAEMIVCATMIRSGVEAAIGRATVGADGRVRPDELYTNAAKYYAASEYNGLVQRLHDIAGGLVVTAPALADRDNHDVGRFVDKYMAAHASTSASDRLKLFHAIRDVSADALGGWFQVTKLMSGGGMYAQKLVARKHYDIEAAKDLARRAAGLGESTWTGG